MVVAQEVDGLAVLPGDGTQSSPAPEFVPATFGQPPAEFLGVVLAAWHDGARGQDSQLFLQHVEERDGVVKAVHEQHVVLVGDLRVLHETADNTAGWSEEGPVAVPDPARVDFCIENVARLGLAQQEALDAPSDRLVAYVLLDGEAVLGGNHALVQAELLAGAVVAAEEREHSVEHGPDFVNLVGLVHGLVRLIDQVQEAPEGDEAVAFHDFPETGGVCDEVVAGPLPVALIPGLDNALLHLEPKAEECFQLGDSDGPKIPGVVWSGLGLLDLLGSEVCLAAQKPPEIGVEEQLEEGKCGALVVDVVWDVLGADVVSVELCVDPGDSLWPARAEILGGGFLWLGVARFGGSQLVWGVVREDEILLVLALRSRSVDGARGVAVWWGRRLAVRVGGGGLALSFPGAADCGRKKQSEYLAKFQRGNVTGKRLYLPAAAAPEERFRGPGVPGVVCLCVPDGPGVGSEMCKWTNWVLQIIFGPIASGKS